MRSRLVLSTTATSAVSDDELCLLARGHHTPHGAIDDARSFKTSTRISQPGFEENSNVNLTLRIRSLKMRFLDRFKTSTSRVRDKEYRAEAVVYGDDVHRKVRMDLASTLPEGILQQIFEHVCPHASDLSYRSWDETAGGSNDCKLCQTKTLAACLGTCKSWRTTAEQLLYQSIRIDISHFCPRREESPKIKIRKSAFLRSTLEPEEPVQRRLRLLTRTLRDNPDLVRITTHLKVPWMIRETSRADLTRVVSVLPNLRYVDLPTGEFENHSADVFLNHELLHACRELRSMRYNKGSDQSFRDLVNQSAWPNLEILDLNGISVEPNTLLSILAGFPQLRELRLGNVQGLEDAVLIANDSMIFRNLSKLSLEGKTSITMNGLCTYLSTYSQLSSLSLIDTDLAAERIYELLTSAPNLKSLTYRNDISKPMPYTQPPLLSSPFLKTLHYELLPTPAADTHISESYHIYLVKSLLSGSLPKLKSVFANNHHFPDILRQPPSQAPAQISTRSSKSSQSLKTSAASESLTGLQSSSTMYANTAQGPEQEWRVTIVDSSSLTNDDSSSINATRPLSMLATAEDATVSRLHEGSAFPLDFCGAFSASSITVVPDASVHTRSKKHSWRSSFTPAKAGSDWMGADY